MKHLSILLSSSLCLVVSSGHVLRSSRQNQLREAQDVPAIRTLTDSVYYANQSNESDSLGNSTELDSFGNSTELLRSINSCSSSQHTVEIDIKTDAEGTQLSWIFRVLGGNTIQRSPQYGSYETYNHQFCADVGMYQLVIRDIYNNINGGYYKVSVQNGDGSWRVALKGTKLGVKQTHLINVGGIESVMTERDSLYLQAHNTRRMAWHGMYNKEYIPLKWSPGLKELSMEYAVKLLDTCEIETPKHDQNNPYGENLARNRGSGSWGQLYEPDKILNRFVEREVGLPWARNGHLTNALWRATKYVGCAEAEKSYEVVNSRGIAVMNTCRVQVCRYAKPGNCSMGKFADSNNKVDWLTAMLQDDSPCGPDCPPEGCYE